MKKKVFYRSKDVMFWLITLIALISSFCYIHFEDHSIYVKWFNDFQYGLFYISLFLHPTAFIIMYKNKILKNED